jgi:hypothetical protein
VRLSEAVRRSKHILLHWEEEGKRETVAQSCSGGGERAGKAKSGHEAERISIWTKRRDRSLMAKPAADNTGHLLE